MTENTDQAARIQEFAGKFFPGVLGISYVSATKDRVVGELTVRDDLCTVPGVLHGGAIMALADSLGGAGASLNLPEGAGTTTIESKTNFFAAGRTGDIVRGECTPLHIGRRTMVWQTRVTSSDGKLLALVTQTQAVLEAPMTPEQALGQLFAGKSHAEWRELLTTLERSAGVLYRQMADAAEDESMKRELLAAAEREDANADALEGMAGKP
jgi:uncharacterized protein (TIGR00369 family)